MSWKAIAFSEAAKSPQKSGLTCQDYAQFIKLNDFGEIVNDGEIIIGVVSKGSEGYKHSDIGPQLAIEATLNYLQDRIKFVGVNELLDISKEEAGLVIQQLFLQTVETVNKNLNIKSQDLRCYGLLVVLATPKWLATMRIGDGFIVVQQPDSEYQLLFEPIKQESANKTNFLPANNASELLEFKMYEGQELIFVSTDNLQVLAFDVRGESKLNPYFFDSLRQAIINNSESQAKEIIKNIFNPKKLKNFKNTTLTFLLCFYKSPFAELNDCNQILTQEVNRLYNELSHLKSDHQQLTEQLEKSEQDLLELRSHNKSLNEDFNQTLTRQANQISELELENEQLTEQLNESKQALSGLLSENDALVEQNSQLNKQISRLQLENTLLNKINKEIKNAPPQNEELTKEIFNLNQRLSTLQLENQSLNKKIQEIRSNSQQKQPSNITKNWAITSTVIATALAGFFFLIREANHKLSEQIRIQHNLLRKQNNLPNGGIPSGWGPLNPDTPGFRP